MSSTDRINLSHLTSAILFTLGVVFKEVQGQDEAIVSPEPAPCGYGSGSMATAIILTFFCTVLIIAFLLYMWKRRQGSTKDNHLILESDPERGVKAEYAFDNPGFKDATLVATSEKNAKPDSSSKIKWGNWSPLSALNLKPEKKRALDDLAIGKPEVKVVALKSQDFTGLGFNICGNMKEGIFIKDILHRGPAFESGKLNPGDRINSVAISFEHMVYEDAMAILSYASPYEVMIEAKSGRIISYTQGQGQNPIHPVYRSLSMMDLFHPEKSAKKKLFGDDYSSSSNYSSLQKSRSNVTTLERKESKSPRPNQAKPKKVDRSPHKTTPELQEIPLGQRMSDEDRIVRDDYQKSDYSPQKPDHKVQKFGVRVLPMENQQKSPKIIEQNQNNINIERNMEEIPIYGIDEVDVNKIQPPQAKKREKKSPEPAAFERNDSGIRRDKDGIPLEIPEHMLEAAVMARRNRKSSVENGLTNGEEISKKTKGKAPIPPSTGVKLNFSLGAGKTKAFEDLSTLGTNDIENNVRYGSDSEEETDNMSSVNTIELNSSDITIHQTEEEERKARKTASTGDLSKMKKAPRSNTGTLERAQSLDITDTSGPSLVKMRTYDATENLLIDREPRISLILDGLTTFQKNRLKKSTEWGRLEDVILNFDQKDDDYDERRKSEPQFNAVMDRVIQIKRESQESEVLPDDVVRQYQKGALGEPQAPKVFNRIWPDEEELVSDSKFEQSGWKRLEPNEEEIPKRNVKNNDEAYMKRQQMPAVPERTKIKVNEALAEPKTSEEDSVMFSTEEKHEKESGEKMPLPAERVSKMDVVLESSRQKTASDSSPKNTSVMNLSNQPNSPITVQFECVKPIPPKRERTPEKETVIDIMNKSRHSQPVTSFERQGISQTCSQIAKDLRPQKEMIKDEWEIDTLNNTSPPQSMTLVDEVMYSYNKNYGTAVTVVQTEDVSAIPGPSVMPSNIPDETKTIVNLKNATADFIFNEQSIYETDTNIPDDVKVSRSSYESIEAKKPEAKPKSDDAKSEDLLVTHVTVTENGGSNLHSLELSINNEPSELYTTALDNTILSGGDAQNDVTVIVSKPDKVTVRKVDTAVSEPLVEITENSFSKVTKRPDEEMSVSVVSGPGTAKDDFKVEITQSKYSKFEADTPAVHILKAEPLTAEYSIDEPSMEGVKNIDDESPAISLTEIKPLEEESAVVLSESPIEDKKTYVTEIQVSTPNSTTLSNVSNVSEVQVTPQSNDDHLESAFENYVKNFESKLEAFESNMQNFENNLEEFIRDEPKSIVLEEKDVEKQASKIQEIAEEQLKTLPEMRFTTSSYETGRKTPEKRHSFELLRSNFEKASNDTSPPRRDSNTPTKSRIPIATTMKTPPMSPERRDSRNLEIENDTAILELMSTSAIHSTPFTSKIKPPGVSTKNVSVTSIKNNSKIPSGLPTLTSRPPIPPRKNEDNGVQVSSPNGGMESSFKQWVFNPNSNVSNVTVGKEK